MFYVMLAFVPLWFSSLLINFPDSPVWLVLSLFPVTAPIQNMLVYGEKTWSGRNYPEYEKRLSRIH